MATKKVTSKNQFAKIAEGLTIQEQGKGYEHCAPVYEYREGTFRCSIDTVNGSIEESIDRLKHAASCLDRYSIITPAELNRRSNRLQRAMAFIGEHREMIPFLTWVYSHTKHGSSVESAVSEYKKKYGQPQFVTREYSYYSKDGRWSFAPKGIYESELVAQVPYLPKAWRCA